MATKKNGTIGVRMPEQMERALRKVAEENNQEAAELLRWAAEAIIECHNTNGSIPRDMELRQRAWKSEGARKATV